MRFKVLSIVYTICQAFSHVVAYKDEVEFWSCGYICMCHCLLKRLGKADYVARKRFLNHQTDFLKMSQL